MSGKKIYTGFALAASLLIFVTGCYKDTSLSPKASSATEVITKTISYKGDILPLFAKDCAISGCHSGGSGSKKPNLSETQAYNSLISGNYINISAPESSEIYMWLLGKRGSQMPPNGLNTTINATVLAWIKQGAKSDN